MAIKVGALTIGQAPRTDVVGDFLDVVGSDVELIQAGALDGLSREEIAGLAPGADESVLVTRLRDGAEVKVAAPRVHERMPAALRSLEASGASLIILLCTGTFPELASQRMLLRPDALLRGLIGALIGDRVLGLCVPSVEQIPLIESKWAGIGRGLVSAAVSPYMAPPSDFEAAANDLAARGADLVVMDCIGYSLEMKKTIRDTIDVPVVLPRMLIGRLVGELCGGI